MNPLNKICIAKAVIGGVGAIAVTVAVFHLLHGTPRASPAGYPTSTGIFKTRQGEHRCENLPDRSSVCLNTNTVVRYTFSRDVRNVELVSGEASMAVQSGDGRPFDVLSGGMRIRDLSTSFDVYKKSDSTLMTVISGRVKVKGPVNGVTPPDFNEAQAGSDWNAAPEYHRLQQVEFDETTKTLRQRRTLTESGLAQLLSWQRGRIDLTRMTLSEALDEFARYQPIHTFKYQDKSLRAVRMGGELGSTNLMDFLVTLQRVFNIRHTLSKGADGKTVVTLSRQRDGDGHRNEKLDGVP